MKLVETNPFNSYYSEFIYVSRYSRWLEEEKRRENWNETVSRYMTYIQGHLEEFTKNKNILNFDIIKELYDAIYNLEVMPSMRTLMTAGQAAKRDNTCTYNCSFLPVDDIKSFDEAMFILLCGTGVGFSVERHNIQKLPEIPEKLFESETTIVVKDSKEGWAKSLRQLMSLLYSGEIPKWDVSRVRPAGARLKIFGGRASGPAPLVDLFEFVVNKFKGAIGRKLNSLECHDILCKIGEIVVVGGVRRSAMISLSDLDDDLIRTAKSIYKVIVSKFIEKKGDKSVYSITYEDTVVKNGNFELTEHDEYFLTTEGKVGWWVVEPQRALSNNSVAYSEKPDVGSFMNEWISLYDSKSGERGIINRIAMQNKAAENGRRDFKREFGVNPCGEIILRPYSFCNLTECVVRFDDTQETLERKVRIATILGTIQSSLTHFPYLRKIWKQNAEEERLLGVSLTGQMDNKELVEGRIDIEKLKQIAIDTNKEWAEILGINQSVAITTVKPSGTVSQLVDAASGLHARHSPYYIRSVRADNKDPLTWFMKDAGIPWEPEIIKPDQITVFYFPIKSPEGAYIRDDFTAIQQLEYWKKIKTEWCEHNPSITVSVRENEWPEVGGWVYNNFDLLSGVSFLPHSDHVYKQAPYDACTEEKYLEVLEKMPKEINWGDLKFYEMEDSTSGMQTLSCTSGSCEVVDIT